MRFSHFTDATAYQWGTMSRNGAPWSRPERLAVHLVGDEDLRRRIGGVGEGQGADEGQVVLVGLRRGSAGGGRRRGRRPRTGRRRRRPPGAPAPAPRAGGRRSSGRSRRRSRPRARRSAAVSSSRRPLPAHSRVTARSTAGMARRSSRVRVVGLLDRAADLERAVVVGQREVAADVVELGGGDLAGEGLRRRLGVVGRRVDHLQCGARRSRSSATAMSRPPRRRVRVVRRQKSESWKVGSRPR